MAEVVNIGEYAFTHKRSSWFKKDECQHRKMTMDDDGHTVRCDECKTQLSAYWVLERMLSEYEQRRDTLNRDRASFREEKAKDVSLLAAKKVEKAWRSRSMVPTCPHCHEPIFPTDGFGASAVNREIAQRRRLLAAEGKDAGAVEKP